MSLGKQIAKIRKQKDWTQDEFAKKVGVHGGHVSRWETDKMRPSLKRLHKIADVLGVSIEELIQGNGTGTAPHDSGYLKEVGDLKEEDKDMVANLIHALATRRRMEKLLHAEE